MYLGLQHTHSFVRYAVLIMLLAVIFKSLLSLASKKPFEKIDNVLSLVLLIVTHVQALVGLVLYFISDKVRLGQEGAMTYSRYFTVEHAFGMILAVIIITAARVTSKKIATDSGKFRRLAFFNLLALTVILATLMVGKIRIIG